MTPTPTPEVIVPRSVFDMMMKLALKYAPLSAAPRLHACLAASPQPVVAPSDLDRTCAENARVGEDGLSKTIPDMDKAGGSAHFGDPCIYCRTPHDEVASGPCPSIGILISRDRAEALLTFARNGRGPAGWPTTLWVEVQSFIKHIEDGLRAAK